MPRGLPVYIRPIARIKYNSEYLTQICQIVFVLQNHVPCQSAQSLARLTALRQPAYRRSRSAASMAGV